jgi:hypothetical protein
VGALPRAGPVVGAAFRAAAQAPEWAWPAQPAASGTWPHAGPASRVPSAVRRPPSAVRPPATDSGAHVRLPKTLARLSSRVGAAASAHRDRHRPTGYAFAIAEHIEQLNPAHWDAVTGDASLFLRRPYLTALGEAPAADMALRYALLYRGRVPVVAVACQLISIDGGRIGARQPLLRRLRTRVLVCGNVFSWGPHGVAIAPGEDPASAWLGVGEALYRIRRAERLSGQTGLVLVKDLAQAAPPAGLRQLSYRGFASDPDMVLEHPPTVRSFADYLAGMNAKYRKAAKDAVAGIGKSGCTLEHVTALGPWAEQAHALYRQVHDRATVKLGLIGQDYLPALARHLGPQGFRATLIHRDGVLLGFVTTLKDGDTAVGYLIGFSEAANAELPLYFRLLYATVEQGLELGCRRLSLGRTALEPKAKLGAKPFPLHIMLRHRVPATNALIGPLLRFIPHDEAPERTVFKE